MYDKTVYYKIRILHASSSSFTVHFPNPEEADLEGEGLICIGADLSLLLCMRPISMVSFPGFLKVIRSAGGAGTTLHYSARGLSSQQIFAPKHEKQDYKITVNHAFERVIRSCSLPRAYADETWISEEIIQGYCDMFDAGYGYSIEVWDEDRVVGGLYGVTIGKGLFR